jgi:hypothetical protein
LPRGGDLARLRRASDRLPTAGYFSLRGQRKVTKRDATPAWRLPGQESGKSVRVGQAFRRGSCPDEKGSTSLSIPLRAWSSNPHHRTGARRSRAQRSRGRGGLIFCRSAPCARPTYTAITTGLRGRAQGALLQGSGVLWIFGSPMARRAGGGKARRVADMDVAKPP